MQLGVVQLCDLSNSEGVSTTEQAESSRCATVRSLPNTPERF